MAYIHQGPDLALNKDRTKVVPAESVEAAFVLVVNGGSLPDDEAARWGLTGEKAKAVEPEDKAKKGSRQNKGS